MLNMVIKTTTVKLNHMDMVVGQFNGVNIYTYHQMLEFGTEGRGFKKVRVPGLTNIVRDPNDTKREIEVCWWVQDKDKDEFPEWGN